MTKELKKLRSLSIKNLGYSAKEIRKLTDEGNGAVFLARIAGIAIETFVHEGTHGESIGFKGEFIAVNARNEQYTSTVAFLPATIAKALKEQFDQGVVEVNVKADIFVAENEKSASGYAYICEPVMSAEQQSRVQKLAQEMFSAKLPTTMAIADNSKTKKEKAA